MQLDPLVRDYSIYLDELMRTLRRPNTRIYLDTSLLMWLIRIGKEARSEFFEWCQERVAGSIRVPVWAAHELHRHNLSQTVRKAAQSAVGETRRKYAEFAGMAAERADENTCRAWGYAGRSSYIGELERSAAVLDRLSQVLKPDDESLRSATEQVIEFVNSHTMASDLNPAIARLSTTSEFRADHRMPPGFEDNGKDKNAFGDVIMWEEILGDVALAVHDPNSDPMDSVFVSLDEKKDWVSSAPQIINEFGRPQSPSPDISIDVALPHPMLVHEYKLQARGGRLFIATPAFLSAALHRESRSSGTASAVQHWLAASHRPASLSRLIAVAESAAARQVAAVRDSMSQQRPQSTAPVGTSEEPDLSAQSSITLMAAEISPLVRQLMDALPEEQGPILEALVERFLRGELSPFAFGRVMSQISMQGLVGWPDQIPTMIEQLPSSLPQTLRNAILLAVLASIYFDRYGDLMAQPATKLASVCLPLEADPGYGPAFSNLNRLLTAADARLPYLPGSNISSVLFSIDAIPGGQVKRLKDIRIGQQPVLIEQLPVNSTRRLSALLGRAPSGGCDGKELRSLLAYEFLIPITALSPSADSIHFTWAPDCGLVIMDTGVEGGLSALASGGDEND